MKDVEDNQEARRRAQPESEELRAATRQLARSLAHTGRAVTRLPVAWLPQRPRQHFLAAGREFTRGWAALVRELADGIDGMAAETRPAARSGENAHAPGRGHVFVGPQDKE